MNTGDDPTTVHAAEVAEAVRAGDGASRPTVPLRMVIWYQRTFAGGTPTCRFYPSCSSYAREALEVHGTRRGLWLTTRRLLRCRPFGPSGVDPVPPPRTGSVPSGEPLGPREPDVVRSDHDRPESSRPESSRKAS